MELIKLTQFSKGSGCGCKVAPRDLEVILHSATQSNKGNLLVGNNTRDDAAVLDIGNGLGLIATTDFFTPIVDDPFDFGRIAAANAISDVYAMGGKPLVALAILGWPIGKIPNEMAQKVLEGARAICAEAGIPLAGGHSIDSSEPIFGLSVNGSIVLSNLKTNSGAKAGDLIFITKPLGVGILATAEKRGVLKPEHQSIASGYMTKLNKIGEAFGNLNYVSAMTDITGFGLLGHLLEMCQGAKLSAHINYTDVPLIPEIKDYVAQFVYADNTMRNWSAFQERVEGISGESLLTLCDPQTNGGLMVAVDPGHEKEFIQVLEQNGYGNFARPVGQFTIPAEKTLSVF